MEVFDISWIGDMEKYTGKIGTITEYTEPIDAYTITFANDYWYYPANLIEQHLVNENEINKMKTVKVKKSDLKRIHEVACIAWQSKIWEIAERDVFSDTIELEQFKIDEMFQAATTSQRPVLVDIFGEPKKQINFDKIKTGSKVMIEYSYQHCSGIQGIDLKKPVDVVFFKSYPYITGEGNFETGTRLYCTFHQDGKFVLFAASENTDYITEVIEY
jgi:hypothetical protein